MEFADENASWTEGVFILSVFLFCFVFLKKKWTLLLNKYKMHWFHLNFMFAVIFIFIPIFLCHRMLTTVSQTSMRILPCLPCMMDTEVTHWFEIFLCCLFAHRSTMCTHFNSFILLIFPFRWRGSAVLFKVPSWHHQGAESLQRWQTSKGEMCQETFIGHKCLKWVWCKVPMTTCCLAVVYLKPY